jgi:hypothetical protein
MCIFLPHTPYRNSGQEGTTRECANDDFVESMDNLNSKLELVAR